MDPLSLLKFEASRLPEQMRAELYQKVYDGYLRQDLFMISTRFTTNELGQFASNRSSLEFMINALRDDRTTRIGIMNHIHVLYYVSLDEFPKEREEIEFYLCRLLEQENLEPYDRLAIVNLLIQKKLLDGRTYEKLLKKYQNNNNA